MRAFNEDRDVRGVHVIAWNHAEFEVVIGWWFPSKGCSPFYTKSVLYMSSIFFFTILLQTRLLNTQQRELGSLVLAQHTSKGDLASCSGPLSFPLILRDFYTFYSSSLVALSAGKDLAVSRRFFLHELK